MIPKRSYSFYCKLFEIKSNYIGLNRIYGVIMSLASMQSHTLSSSTLKYLLEELL